MVIRHRLLQNECVGVKPIEKRRNRIIILSIIAALGGGLYGYDTGVISGALLAMDVQGSGLVLNDWDKGLITSMLLVGASAGSYFGGLTADRFGRRAMMRVAAVFFTVGAVLCATAPSFAILLAARVILGTGLGASSVIVPLYIGEMAPPRSRGRLVSINTVMMNVSQFAAIIVNASVGINNSWDWRIMLAVAAVPAVIFGIGTFFVAETPNWWAHRGDDRRARDTLLLTRTPDEAEQELYLIKENIAAEREGKELATFRNFIRVPWLRRTLIAGCGVAMMNQLGGVNVMIYFAPTLFANLGFNPSNALLSSLPIGFVSMVAALIGGLGFIDRFKRRRFLMVGLAGVVICHICVGIAYHFVDPTNPSMGSAMVLLGFILLFLTINQGIVSPVTWLLIAEVFPAKVRGRGMGLSVLAMNIANFVISLLFLPVLQSVGGTFTFWGFALINVGCFIFAYYLIPETRGKSLELIEQEARHRQPELRALPAH